MKAILFVIQLSIFSVSTFAQCRVQSNQREDGTKIRYLRPDRIGFSDKLILALSMQTNGEQYFVAALSVFETNSFKLKGSLTLKFANNKSSTLQHLTSELTTYNGYPATISIFSISKNSLSNIAGSNITMAMLQLADNVYQVVTVKMNGDILKRHYSCLTQ
jgi:hypothetical protein